MDEPLHALADNLIDTIKTMLAGRDQKIAALEISSAAFKGAIATLAAMPSPQPGRNGKDADLEIVKQMLAEEIAKIPPAADGKSVDLNDLRPIIEREVLEAIAKLPPPMDGKNADSEIISLMVQAAIDGIPKPQDGKSVTLQDLHPIIRMEVKAAVAGLPPPVDGKDADSESIRRMVKEVCDAMPKPISGSDGRDGLDGRDGRDGRDGLELEILPSIDEAKSYPRGTYATHDGGFWRAYEKTAGMRGWECLVDGVSEITVEQQCNRSIVITAKKSSGMEIVKTLDLPVMIYTGIYTEGKNYSPGDVATWGGDLWHCNQATGIKPHPSDEWTLCVRRGRVVHEKRP